MNLIDQLEAEEIKRLNKDIPDFSPGDTVIVNVNVVEGDRKRTQAYALYSKISNDKNGNYDFGAGTGIGNQQAVSAGSNISAFGVGLRHSF